MLAQRRTTNKIQQDEKQQSGLKAGGARGRSPSAGGACEAPPSTSNSKIQQPGALTHLTVTLPPPGSSLQRSPKAYARPHRSPQQAQGIKSQAVDRESIRLVMDDVLQKHTNQILQAIQQHTSTILESSGGSHLFEDLPEASVAFVGPAEKPAARQRQPSQDQSLKSEIMQLEENENTDTWRPPRNSGNLEQHLEHLEIPRKGELLDICKTAAIGTKHPWLVSLEEWMEWWDKLKNPQGTRRIDKFVTSVYFQLSCVVIILSNTIFVAVDANTQMEHYKNNTLDASLPKADTSYFSFCTL